MFELSCSFLLPYGPEYRVGTFLPRGENAKNPFSPKKVPTLPVGVISSVTLWQFLATQLLRPKRKDKRMLSYGGYPF